MSIFYLTYTHQKGFLKFLSACNFLNGSNMEMSLIEKFSVVSFYVLRFSSGEQSEEPFHEYCRYSVHGYQHGLPSHQQHV